MKILNEKDFWGLIEKNKNNPQDFICENLEKEDIFIFHEYLCTFSKNIDSHFDFLADISIEFDLVNYVECEDRVIFGSAFDDIGQNIVFGGKDLYEAFINEDISYITEYIKNNGKEIFGDEILTEILVYKKYIVNTVTAKELEIALNEKFGEYLERFYDEKEEYLKQR